MATERSAILLRRTQPVQPVRFTYECYLFENARVLISVGDITHGGLSLKETPAWVEAKRAIETESEYKIVQWHKDELSEEVCNYYKGCSLIELTICR
jgi:hypothetical protein